MKQINNQMYVEFEKLLGIYAWENITRQLRGCAGDLAVWDHMESQVWGQVMSQVWSNIK